MDAQGLPVPWYDSELFAFVHAGEKTLNVAASIEPTFFNVTFALPESPGFFTVRLNSWSQDGLTFESGVPPPVDRQAVPPCFVFCNTSVPSEKMLLGLSVSAFQVAKLEKPSTAARPSARRTLARTFRCLDMGRWSPFGSGVPRERDMTRPIGEKDEKLYR